jgi:hypothetical protein
MSVYGNIIYFCTNYKNLILYGNFTIQSIRRCFKKRTG